MDNAILVLECLENALTKEYSFGLGGQICSHELVLYPLSRVGHEHDPGSRGLCIWIQIGSEP
jgi:hypothetical protein